MQEKNENYTGQVGTVRKKTELLNVLTSFLLRTYNLFSLISFGEQSFHDGKTWLITPVRSQVRILCRPFT